MKVLILALVIAGLTTITVVGMDPVPASSPAGPNGKLSLTRIDSNDIEILIQLLGDENHEVRVQAEGQLRRMGHVVLAPLKLAVASAKKPEIRHRATGLIRKIRFDQILGKGKAVNGLKLVVQADSAKLVDGKSIVLNSYLQNTTQHPLKVQLGYSTCGNYLECGSAMRMALGSGDGPAKTAKPQWRVGFCGTGAYPLKRVLLPGETVVYQTPVSFNVNKNGTRGPLKGGAKGWVADALMIGSKKFLHVGLAGADVAEIRMTLQVKGPEGFGFRGAPLAKAAPDPAGTKYWNGQLTSAPIRLPIERPYAKITGTTLKASAK